MTKEWILIFKNELDRINRIERPSAEGRLAAGEKKSHQSCKSCQKK